MSFLNVLNVTVCGGKRAKMVRGLSGVEMSTPPYILVVLKGRFPGSMPYQGNVLLNQAYEIIRLFSEFSAVRPTNRPTIPPATPSRAHFATR
jgi:hypothetical protein